MIHQQSMFSSFQQTQKIQLFSKMSHKKDSHCACKQILFHLDINLFLTNTSKIIKNDYKAEFRHFPIDCIGVYMNISYWDIWLCSKTFNIFFLFFRGPQAFLKRRFKGAACSPIELSVSLNALFFRSCTCFVEAGFLLSV